MDILIKNMEMPKSCYSEVYSSDGYCPFHCFDYHGGSHCTISACKCLKTRRPKDCPLIPVPEHGDLIDRDALREDAKLIQKNDTGFFIDSMSYGEALSRAVDNAEVVLERTT